MNAGSKISIRLVRTMKKSRSIALRFVLCMAALLAFTEVRGQTETVSIAEAPDTLPRGQPLTNYSPALRFAYSGLNQGTYSLRVFLLETGNYFCASGQWCGTASNPPAVFTISNSNGANSSGTLTIV